MNQRVAIVLILALVATMAVCAQRGQPAKSAQAAQAASQTPVAKQPQVKSKGEAEALNTVFNAQDPDTRLTAIQDFLAKYNDSEFKAVAMQLAAATYQQKNDFENMVIWAERTLEADPNSFAAMLMLATGIASRTREFDLDREEKLARAEKYAHAAEDILKTALKPNPGLTDEQWETAKKDIRSQAHEALAMAAIPRKKYDVAIAEFKTALEIGNTPDPATQVRLGVVYNMAGKYDEAIATLDKVMAAADVLPQIKQYAQAERVRAIQSKAAGAKPAAPPAAAAPPQVEIKKP